MLFKIVAQHLQTGKRETFTYDNEANALTAPDGSPIAYPEQHRAWPKRAAREVSRDVPIRKSARVHVLKIQLGLSCNYSCDYCSQRFVERPPATSKKDIEAFMRKLDVLDFSEQDGLKIEFWGGEPLVYIKTLMPLVDALNARFAHWERPPVYSMITNGSLLNDEINDWILRNHFAIAVSHDGPGQHVRGPDPFDDPETRQAVLDLYAVLKPLGRFSFNAMMHAGNTSREAIHQWFIDFTGDPYVVLGEGSLVDAYDEGGAVNSLTTKAQHFAYRKQAFNDIRSTEGNIGFTGVVGKVDGFIRGVLGHADAVSLGQKCGMDADDTLAIDLRGNVLTCQNVSVTEPAPNGESHCGGTLDDFGAVAIKSATHWRNRPHCAACPVVHLCQGACMFLEGEYWETSCANAYSDNIALFALAFEKITGFVPLAIEGGNLPAHRADIWGDLAEHEEVPKRRVIPIVAAKQQDGTFARAHAEV